MTLQKIPKNTAAALSETIPSTIAAIPGTAKVAMNTETAVLRSTAAGPLHDRAAE
jgi:hypothetical protein